MFCASIGLKTFDLTQLHETVLFQCGHCRLGSDARSSHNLNAEVVVGPTLTWPAFVIVERSFVMSHPVFVHFPHIPPKYAIFLQDFELIAS